MERDIKLNNYIMGDEITTKYKIFTILAGFLTLVPIINLILAFYGVNDPNGHLYEMKNI